MSEIEMPDKAVRDYLSARFGGYSDDWGWAGRIESAQITLAAAYPAIRSQVLEGVVESVAAALPSYLSPAHRELRARAALGLPSEGKGSDV